MRLKDTAIFKEMSEQTFKTATSDYQIFSKKYGKGESVPQNKKWGIVLSGEISVAKNDEGGSTNIIEFLTEGNLVVSEKESDSTVILCNKAAEIAYFDCRRIIEKAPKYVVNNLFKMLTEKSEWQNTRINILCSRSIRKKLARYFETLCIMRKSKKVKIPFSYSTLADYLAVDRSAMTRELKKMEHEGLILTENRVISVLWDVEL